MIKYSFAVCVTQASVATEMPNITHTTPPCVTGLHVEDLSIIWSIIGYLVMGLVKIALSLITIWVNQYSFSIYATLFWVEKWSCSHSLRRQPTVYCIAFSKNQLAALIFSYSVLLLVNNQSSSWHILTGCHYFKLSFTSMRINLQIIVGICHLC